MGFLAIKWNLKMCTSFAVYSQENAIYGMNFDAGEIDLRLKLICLNDKSVFYFSGLLDDVYRDIAGINSDGIFICTQAVEYGLGFKSSCDENDWSAFEVFDGFLKNAKEAAEFFEVLDKRVIAFPKNPLFPDFGLHTIIADKAGCAFVLEEGVGKNITSHADKGHIVMTNFQNGNFKEVSCDEVYGCGADRYIRASEYIGNHIHGFGRDEAFEVLKRTTRDDTLCSIVFEPSKNDIYISFKIDLSKRWRISINEKTIQSLDGFLGESKMQFADEGIFVKDLVGLYK